MAFASRSSVAIHSPAQSVPVADVPAAKRSNAGLVAVSWPMRLEAPINSTVAHGENHSSVGSCWSASLAAPNAS